jgi:hypothetical protein
MIIRSERRRKDGLCGKEADRASPEDVDDRIQLIPLPVVYNELPSFMVDRGQPTAEVRQLADLLFDGLIVTAKDFKPYKLKEKKAYFCDFLHTSLRAIYHDGCIRHSLKRCRYGCTDVKLQVLRAMVDVDLLHEIKSPRGSPNMSRYIPRSLLRQYALLDPWNFDEGPRSPNYVILRRRGEDKVEIPFDPNDPTARDAQSRLELVNEVNSRFEITYVQHDAWGMNRSHQERMRRLRPVHYAIFTDNFEQHGRLYTREYGHQSLRKSERETIRFGREASVEVDFRGMHPRILYHLEGLDYRQDPYHLWGQATTEPMRLMAKLLINTAINAGSESEAIAACNFAMSSFTNEKDEHGKRRRKQSKELQDAIKLQEAVREAGLSFSQIYPLAVRHHRAIQESFGSDAGIRLMRHDSAIALDILHHFARRCIPCLGVHDSFIVPKRHEAELRRAMMSYYKRRLGFFPELSK